MDYIDQFPFMRIEQPPNFGHLQRALRTRPGVNGALVMDLGSWAEPITLTAMSAHENTQAALQAYAKQYLPKTAGPPVTLKYANCNVASALGTRFHVLAVSAGQLRAVAGFGPFGAYGAVLTTTWTLQPT